MKPTKISENKFLFPEKISTSALIAAMEQRFGAMSENSFWFLVTGV